MELGTWIGRRQAFGLFASKCSAADAECLKHIRDSKRYKPVVNNWDEFCPRYLGVSRAQADKIIQRLEEFGSAYFELSQIVRIPEAAYRTISGAISGHAIEFNGRKIPICAENGREIAEVVQYLRDDAAVATRCLDGLGEMIARKKLSVIRRRLDAIFTQLEEIGGETDDRTAFVALIEYGLERLSRLAPPKA